MQRRAQVGEGSLARLVIYRLRWAIVAFVGLAAIATAGYVAIEGYGWFDAAYMTMITLSTVGYKEVRPLGTGGRLLTMAVIACSFTTVAYAASALTNFYTSGEAVEHLRVRRGRRARMALSDHVIVVGFGRVGQAAAAALRESGMQCLVVDRDPLRETEINQLGAVQLIGDATSAKDLQEAGIDRAMALVAAADSDESNLIVVLTARSLRDDLRIVSRVNDAEWLSRIQQAGADVAQSPYPSYGRSLATAAMSPTVLDLHDLPLLGLGTEEVLLSSASSLLGLRIPEIAVSHPGVHVVGLRRHNTLLSWDEFVGPTASGDVIVALGRPEHLKRLAAEA